MAASARGALRSSAAIRLAPAVRLRQYPSAMRAFAIAVAAAVLLSAVRPAAAQDLEPRRWSHLPSGLNIAGAGYAFTAADVFFDPVLGLEDVTLDQHTAVLKYIRTFALLDRSARAEIAVPYQDAHWKGLLQGSPAEARRQGWADPIARFAVNLVGAPALSGAEFAAYRAGHPRETVVGLGLSMQAPLGEYFEDKLLNLGENRFTWRPELGIEHMSGKWISEITGSTSFFTDNDDFWNGNRREQDPLHFLHGHMVYVIRPGLWAGGGVGYAAGGESTVNGTPKDDPKGILLAGATVGVPVSRAVGIKFTYLRARAQEDTGSDSDSLIVAASARW